MLCRRGRFRCGSFQFLRCLGLGCCCGRLAVFRETVPRVEHVRTPSDRDRSLGDAQICSAHHEASVSHFGTTVKSFTGARRRRYSAQRNGVPLPRQRPNPPDFEGMYIKPRHVACHVGSLVFQQSARNDPAPQRTSVQSRGSSHSGPAKMIRPRTSTPCGRQRAAST